MSDDQAVTLYTTPSSSLTDHSKNSYSIKLAIAQVLRGGAVVEVSTLDQAKTAESAGACCVCVTAPPPPQPTAESTISRMPDPSLIKEIKHSVTIPVMAKARVGHFVEAQILQSIGVDYIDESQTLGLADDDHFINKHNFNTPFANGCHDLGQALCRIREGAALLRSEGSSLAETVKSVRKVLGEVRTLSNMDDDEVFTFAKKINAPYDVVAQAKQMGRLPVVHFASGGIETPADAALMMQLGCDGVFVGVEVFENNGGDAYSRLRAIVRAVRRYNDIEELAEVSCGLGDRCGLEEDVERLSVNESPRIGDVGGHSY